MIKKQKATLLFDGNCGICREWVNYWQKLNGEHITYRPYQEAQSEYPNIAPAELAKAIHLIQEDGTISKGAEATFKLYRGFYPQALLLWLYQHLPGCALLSELGYRFFSSYRGLLAFITHLFWGRNFVPPKHELISRLFLRLLAFVYLIAFLSFYVQADVLISSKGVLPLEYFLAAVKDQFGSSAYTRLPTLFWINYSDSLINAVCLAGIVVSLCLLFGRLIFPCLVILYVLYLSIVNVGQDFMSFQWDLLLLECGFLALFLPWGSKLVVWLFRWLVFRFMFLGGVVKIVSNDPSWDSLTALFYHFETQPLPTPLSWYVHHLPNSVLMTATGLTLVIELLLPFFIFAPRRFRHIVGLCFIGFQSIIILTGNYNFFNLLTICMCLFLFDDAALRRIIPDWLFKGGAIYNTGKIATTFAMLMLLTSLYMGTSQLNWFMNIDRPLEHSAFYKFVSPFSIVNPYGPFAVMTRERNEIVLEGSSDKVTWKEYGFKYKPGDLSKCPTWVEPHQPRIDWQMWFASLSKPEQQRWLFNLIVRLLQHSEPVVNLFDENPFKTAPPVSIRALFYHYTFTTSAEREQTGNCWKRRLISEYIPPVTLNKN